MKLTKLKIKNILGIEDIEFDAGKFTTITGANSSGKSSIFKAIQNVFQGGHEANLLLPVSVTVNWRCNNGKIT